MDKMPSNRIEAWRKIQPLRLQAASRATVHEAEPVFRRAFDIRLEDLVALSEDSHWSGTKRGRNRWADSIRSDVQSHEADFFFVLERI
jgi:hypothetical protein